MKGKYNIGDKVVINQCEVQKIFTIYSITEYMGGRLMYTLWTDDDYATYDEWQISKYVEPAPIGLTIE